MVNSTAMSPVEFGNALREFRLGAEVGLEAISERTKIGRRMLEQIEAGQFDKLPDRVFVRMFVQQYVDIVGGDRDTWMQSFDAAWARYERGSQQFAVAPGAEIRPRRGLGPWVIGILLVVLVLAVLFVLQRRDGGGEAPVALPTPKKVATAIAPTPSQPPVITTPSPAPTVVPTVGEGLVFETDDQECWVQVAIQGGATVSQLIPPHGRWGVATGGAAAAITIGAAEAVRVSYLGEPLPISGRPGSVVHIEVPATPVP